MTALGVLAVLVLVILGALAWALHKHGRRHLKRRGGPRRGVIRLFITGRHWDGTERCDRGWFRWGKMPLPATRAHPQAVMTPWVRAPGRCGPEARGVPWLAPCCSLTASQ